MTLVKKKPKIGTLVFGGGVSTLGMDVIIGAMEDAGIDEVAEIERLRPQDIARVKSVDILLVSLYWWDNIFDMIQYFVKNGINPKAGKPHIIVGGANAINPQIIDGYFHTAVLGDGELVIGDLMRSVLEGEKKPDLPGVIHAGDFDTHKELLTNPVIPARPYVELRGNQISRIEIARGCRFNCPFCQLSHIKPYREQPFAILKHLIAQCPTKGVGMFAPDRTGHSEFNAIEDAVRRAGKHNAAEDARLDMLLKQQVVTKVKFGIEAFSADMRRYFKKIPTNEMLIKGFRHIFEVLHTPKGRPMTTANAYVIADLPGEGQEALDEFWGVLREIDKFCPRKFTLFLVCNSFAPKPFTPMERCGINPYTDFNKRWLASPVLENMTIAQRGGCLGPSMRYAQQMTYRGDARLARVVFYLSTEGRKILRTNSAEAGRAVEKLVRMVGVDPEVLVGELPESHRMPHEQFSIQPLPESAKPGARRRAARASSREKARKRRKVK